MSFSKNLKKKESQLWPHMFFVTKSEVKPIYVLLVNMDITVLQKREKSVNKLDLFSTYYLPARQMSWEPLEALWSYSNINAETHLSFRFGMHNADQFHFYFFAFAVIPILLNFDFRGICKKKDSNVYLFVYYILSYWS